MRVPVSRSARTNVTPLREGYARAPGVDFSPLTNELRGFAKDLEQERKKAEEFDLQKRFIQETNELQSDFEIRKQQQPLGAQGFTSSVLDEYEQRHTKLLDEYYAKGYNVDALQGMAVRLGSLREQFGERALAFQADSTAKLADSEISQYTTQLSQFATNNPDGYLSSKDELRTAIDRFPGLTAQQKETLYENQLKVVQQGAAKGLAMTNPGLVLQALDPNGLTAPAAFAPSGGAYQTLSGWQSVAGNVAKTFGLNPTDVAAIMSYETGGTFSPTVMGGKGGRYMGLIQFGEWERQKYGITAQSTPEQWTTAITSFLNDRGFKPGMGVLDLYSTINAGRPGRYGASDGNGTVRSHVQKILGEHRGKAEAWLRQGAPVQEASGVGGGIVEIDPGGGPSVAPPEVSASVSDEFNPLTAKTGHPILDDMTGPERLQVLGWAREQQNRQSTALKASMDIAIQNATSSYMATGQYAGPVLTREQMVSVYGPIEGEQKWGQYAGAQATGQAIQRIKTLPPAQIEAQVAALRPNPSSPTFAEDQRFYEAAVNAQRTIAKQRADDPAAYVMQAFPEIGQQLQSASTPAERKAAYAALDRAYEQIGIPERERYYGTDEQIAAIGRQYEQAPAGQKLALIEGLASEMGWRGAGRTLGKGVGSEVAADFALYATLRTLPTYRATFERVMAGRDIIAKDPARKPSESLINQSFGAGVGRAINNLGPDLSRLYNEATAALYVKDGGQTKDRALSDPRLYQKSLREALGGQPDNPDTGIVNKSQGQARDWTILPAGVTGVQLDNWVEGLVPGDLTRLSVNGRQPTDKSGRHMPLQDIINEGVFVMMAPGIYGIKMASDGKFVGDGRGGAFQMRLDKDRMGIR